MAENPVKVQSFLLHSDRRGIYAFNGPYTKRELDVRSFPLLRGRNLDTWRTFLSVETDIDSYSKELPGRVADLIERARNLELYDKIVIWEADNLLIEGDMGRRLVDSQSKMAVAVYADLYGEPQYFPIAQWGTDILSPAEIRASLPYVKKQAKAKPSTKANWFFGILGTLMIVGVVVFGIGAFESFVAEYGWFEAIGIICLTVLYLVYMVFGPAVHDKFKNRSL